MPSPRYTTRFSISAHVCRPSLGKANEIYASIDRLKGLLPEDVDPEQHPTLLYVVGNLFVAGLLNRNDDGVTIEDGLKMYKAFEGQQINIEHNRTTVVGYIVKAGLSEFGTDRLITEEEARAANKPFNVAIAIAVWKVVDPELAKYILMSAEPGSPLKDDLSLSFEVGFDDYQVVTLPKGVVNLSMVTRSISSTEASFKEWDKRLRDHKGSGLFGQERVGRVLVWPIIPLGGGIVAMPAGQVKGITPVTSNTPILTILDDSDAKLDVSYEYSSTQCTLDAAAAAPFLAYSSTIPDDQLYTTEDPSKEGKYGREDEPHITAFYGIKGNDISPIQLSLTGCGPVRARLGKISAFVNEDKPYDVLKIDVESDDLHKLHALIGASCDCDETWPVYHPHITLAYVKKGMSMPYVGASDFEGMELSFNSLTFSPAEGEKQEIPLGATVPPTALATIEEEASSQNTNEQVYNSDEDHDLMASTPTRFLKLPLGWQERLASMQAQAGGNPLVNGVDVTLSDGRTLKNLKIFSGDTLELDKELAFNGVVITDMTPGVAAPNYIAPGKEDIYPTKDAPARAEDAAQEAKRMEAINLPYTDASIKTACEALNVLESFVTRINIATAGVSTSTTVSNDKPMDLDTLKQTIAAVKSPEDLTAAVASVASFADIIAKASEEQAAARKAAEDTAAAAQASLTEVQAKLEALTLSHNELIAAQQAAAAEAAFQSRMASVEEVFAFDDDARADVNEEIKACADDEAFAKWMTRAKRMYKGFLKASTEVVKTAVATDDKDKDDEKDMKEKEDCKAAAKTALASAKTTIVDAPIANTLEAAAGETLQQRYEKIALKHIRLGGETAEVLTARAKATVKTTR